MALANVPAPLRSTSALALTSINKNGSPIAVDPAPPPSSPPHIPSTDAPPPVPAPPLVPADDDGALVSPAAADVDDDGVDDDGADRSAARSSLGVSVRQARTACTAMPRSCSTVARAYEYEWRPGLAPALLPALSLPLPVPPLIALSLLLLKPLLLLLLLALFDIDEHVDDGSDVVVVWCLVVCNCVVDTQHKRKFRTSDRGVSLYSETASATTASMSPSP